MLDTRARISSGSPFCSTSVYTRGEIREMQIEERGKIMYTFYNVEPNKQKITQLMKEIFNID